MLWNQVYEFFVQYIFGGTLVNGNVYTSYSALFSVYYFNSDDKATIYTRNVLIDLFGQNISFGNYLSLIATIITMVAILLFCVFIIKKIIGIIFRLFTGSSAF